MYHELKINSKGNTMLYPEPAVKSSFSDWSAEEIFNHDMEDKTI